MLKERVKRTPSGRNSHHPAGGLPLPGQNRHRHHSKSSQNQNSNSNKVVGQRTSASLPNPVVRHQAKVRVQAGAGDKCVAPVKSKQKRRQAVPGRPIDHSALSMDAIVWSDEVYSISQLIHAYGAKLPVITKIIEGYHTNNGLDLSQNQVIQCHSFDKQLRVRAKIDDGTGRISMPSNYPIQVFYKEGDIEERTSLSLLLQTRKPPLNVLVMSINEDISVSTVNVIGRRLVIMELYQEAYMRINTITDGWLDQEGIYAIPSCFGPTFSVAVGMRGASEAEWADYYGMFARSVRHLNFDLLSGYDGIIIEDDAGGTITLDVPKVQAAGGNVKRVYENISLSPSDRRSQTLDPKPSTSRQNHVYENMALRGELPLKRLTRNRPPSIDCVNGEIVTKQSERAPSPTKKSDALNSAFQQTGFDPPTGLPDLILTPTPNSRLNSEAKEDDVEEMFQSVLDVAAEQETMKKKSAAQSEKREEQMLMFAKRRKEEEERRERIRLQMQQKEFDRVGHPPSTSSAKSSYSSEAIKPVPAASKDRWQGVNNRSSSDLPFVSSVKVEIHRESTTPTRADTDVRDVKALAKRFESPNGSTTELNSSPILLNARTPRNDGKVTPKAVVAPNVRSAPHVSRIAIVDGENKPTANGVLGQGSTPESSSNSPRDTKHQRNEINAQREINSMEDVPKDVSVLTADNVCKCLVLLNMERHLVEFQRRHVNGRLLITLKETVLINEYKFTPFNASKLIRFIRGWRPKSL